MYCPSCGAESAHGLRYCKRCGGSLAALTESSQAGQPVPRFTGAVWAISLATVAVGLGGLGIVFNHVYDLALNPAVNQRIPVLLTVFGLATVFGIVAMLLWLLSRIIGAPRGLQGYNHSAHLGTTKPQAPSLAAKPDTIPSVTEQTTRGFEHQRYNEPGALE